MTPNEYQFQANRTSPQVTNEELKLHALHGLCGEVGEIHSLFRKYIKATNLMKYISRKK